MLPPTRRPASALFPVGALVLGLFGCGGSATPERTDLVEVEFLGSTVRVPERAVRIAAGNVGTLELALGIVPMERFAAVPAEGYEYSVLGDDPALLDGKLQYATFEAEAVLAGDPDLVLASDWQALETCSALERAGVPVIRVPTPASWSDLEATLRDLGAVLGEPAAAEQICAALAARRKALLARAKPYAQLRALVYSNYGAGGATAAKGSTWEAIFTAAGLKNAATVAGMAGHPTLDLEALIDLDPDILVLSNDVTGEATLAELRALPPGSGLRPLAPGGLILRLPQTLFATSSQHMLDAAESLIDQLEEQSPR